MTKEHYSPGSASPPFIGFHQVVGHEPVITTNAGNNCCAEREPTAHECLDDLIMRCGVLVEQLEAFRNSMPDWGLQGAACQGFKAVAKTTLGAVEDDTNRLQHVRDSLVTLRESLPRKMAAGAEAGLRILIDHYRFVLSRERTFPN